MSPPCRTRPSRAAAARCPGARPLTPAADERHTRRVVGAARGGDREALGELYVLHGAAVHAHVLRVVKDRDDADDVTQQVFVRLLTGLDRYRPAEAPFVVWMLRVARNAAIDHRRRARVLPVADLAGRSVADDRLAGEVRSALRAALAALPQRQRDVLVLTHLVGLSPREIAAALGCTVRAVHGLHYRGRAAARAALTELGSTPAVLRLPSEPHPDLPLEASA